MDDKVSLFIEILDTQERFAKVSGNTVERPLLHAGIFRFGSAASYELLSIKTPEVIVLFRNRDECRRCRDLMEGYRVGNFTFDFNISVDWLLFKRSIKFSLKNSLELNVEVQSGV